MTNDPRKKKAERLRDREHLAKIARFNHHAAGLALTSPGLRARIDALVLGVCADGQASDDEIEAATSAARALLEEPLKLYVRSACEQVLRQGPEPFVAGLADETKGADERRAILENVALAVVFDGSVNEAEASLLSKVRRALKMSEEALYQMLPAVVLLNYATSLISQAFTEAFPGGAPPDDDAPPPSLSDLTERPLASPTAAQAGGAFSLTDLQAIEDAKAVAAAGAQARKGKRTKDRKGKAERLKAHHAGSPQLQIDDPSFRAWVDFLIASLSADGSVAQIEVAELARALGHMGIQIPGNTPTQTLLEYIAARIAAAEKMGMEEFLTAASSALPGDFQRQVVLDNVALVLCIDEGILAPEAAFYAQARRILGFSEPEAVVTLARVQKRAAERSLGSTLPPPP